MSGRESPPPRVLVADDDSDVLALVSLRLERSGYHVIRAADGAEALRLALEETPDLAVLDVSMPKLDGYEVTRRIRGDRRTRGIPVILLTARVQTTDVAQGLEAGANGYVVKPFGSKELRARVQSVLGRA